MARKKQYANERILSLEYQGHGIAKPEGRVLFVEGVLPGELVDIAITKQKKDHAFGRATAISQRRLRQSFVSRNARDLHFPST